MVREIVRQIKLNPNQIPAVPIVYRRNNMDKVSVRRRFFFIHMTFIKGVPWTIVLKFGRSVNHYELTNEFKYCFSVYLFF